MIFGMMLLEKHFDDHVFIDALPIHLMGIALERR